MEHFSWSDNIRAAFAPCLACLRTAPDDEDASAYNHHAQSQRGPDYVPRARADELEGLLADADDAETLSLHSNLGRDDRRRKRRRQKKGIKLFGLDLFGKPPIQLPEDEDERPEGEGGDGTQRRRTRTISASGLDSDATSLDPSQIDLLSATRDAEAAAQREEERRAKEERRKRRREKKAAHQAALALALERSQDEFEGFPGSGPAYAVSSSGARSSDAQSSTGFDDFGPLQQAQARTTQHNRDETDFDGADFGAEAYAKRPTRSGGSNGTGSDSRSRSSASHSRSESLPFNHHYLSQMQPADFPLPPSPLSPTAERPRRKKSRSSRHSISTATQSIATPPPHTTTFPGIAEHDQYPSPIDSVPILNSEMIRPPETSTGFPSVGFGGGLSRKNSEAGVFLARRGDE